MAGSINSVVLVGRLTRDAEVRKTQSGLSVATFTVACDRRFSSQNGNQNGQQQQPSADFISCVAWRQQADFLGSYAHKGSLVGIQGSIQTRNYTAQDGRKVYVTEVVCERVQLLESKNASQSRSDSGSYGYGNYGNAPQDPYAGGMNHGSADTGAQPSASDGFNTGPSLDISSDDLPF